MPIKLEGIDEWFKPTTEWKSVAMTADLMTKLYSADKNFYVTTKKVD